MIVSYFEIFLSNEYFCALIYRFVPQPTTENCKHILSLKTEIKMYILLATYIWYYTHDQLALTRNP